MRLSGSPKLLRVEEPLWRVRSKRLLDGGRSYIASRFRQRLFNLIRFYDQNSSIAPFTRRYTPNTTNHSARLTIEVAIADAIFVC